LLPASSTEMEEGGPTILWSGKSSIIASWDGAYLHVTVEGRMASLPTDATLGAAWLREQDVRAQASASNQMTARLSMEHADHRPPEPGDQLRVSRRRGLTGNTEGWQATVTFSSDHAVRVFCDISTLGRSDWSVSDQEVKRVHSAALARLSEDERAAIELS